MAELQQDHASEESLARDYVRSLADAGMSAVESVAYIRSLDVGQDTLQQEETEGKSDQNLTQLQRSAAFLDIVKAGADQRMQVICLERVKTALESEDYESAAKFILKFLQIDSQSKDSKMELRAELLALKKQLEDIVKVKLLAAIKEKIYPTIMRFVRLYTPLGMEKEGLKLYVGYLKNVIALRGFTNYQQVVLSVEQGYEQVDFVGCFTNLFHEILMTIQDNDAILRALGGEDGIVYAICELQAECDFRGSLIWQKYKDYRMLDRFTNQNLPGGVPAPERPDPKVAELCVKEILQLMRLTKDYTELMVSKLRSVDPELLPRNSMAFQKGTFTKEIQDVTGLYVILENFYGILERFFMVESVRLAIRIDNQLPDSLIASMVGDVFYLLKTSLLRAISTSNIRCVLSVLGGAASLLGNDYHDALQRKTGESHIDARLYVDDMVANNTETHENASTLNDIDVSCEYILKLHSEIEEQCSKVFAPAPADHERIKSCLSKLEELGNTFKQSGLKKLVADRERINSCLSGVRTLRKPFSQACMEQLVAIVTERIRPVLETVATMSYELTETEHAQNEECSPWVKLLFNSVETNAASLKSQTISDNYESFLDLIIEFITKRLEVLMMQKCFSQLGGLQLAQDTTALTSHFSDMTKRDVTHKFARLNQMAGLLKSNKYLFVQEIMEFCCSCDSGTMTLTPGEILSVLSLRVEFKPEPTPAHFGHVMKCSSSSSSLNRNPRPFSIFLFCFLIFFVLFVFFYIIYE